MDLDFDRAHIWHPYSSLIDPPPVYPIARAEGVHLYLEDGRALIDGMSSWWCALHGYNVPELNTALQKQMEKMSHVMFGGLTHQPAIDLCKKLVEITPQPLQRVFLADSGSVSVEVAIKMALQYWHSQGRPEKNKLLALRNGYHGDTFGAMAACDPVTGMHHLFAGQLTQHFFAPAPRPAFNEPCKDADIAELQQLIEKNHGQLAAVILEPIVQGAGGMRFYSPEYLQRVRELCDQHELLLIADEIATGFGRSGKLFACEHAGISPDILTLGKALTGGTMTLAATLCTDKVAEGICRGEAGVFMHGPTFMGNPLACAVSNASIDLLLSSPWQRRVASIEQQLQRELAPLRNADTVADVRCLGAIGVVEMREPVDMARVQEALIARGVWLRPFGKLVYAMPPYVISEQDLSQLTNAMVEVLA
ncbi:adenosylmethionine--8-amino-7-oxononanoate transaminase [Microbulbifer thermotolerans]|uniref:Adenosylmethionine-8-amino-7-oxononanoate aminotransferase n=1 Tax=Microbulbifer thermotolerans TaxID=252514 RepID=A0AB35HZN3_MICTH|nr:adenosylmethionine--8-amino-7-oxononanoate transaminase [Microbulbifer thermotolerans]MCX2779928.1 adenosylmethionine--8-amino-7-oxononanoate transaminase [Microbulbifer thermotolerans]MCX2802810.1 adenosylmethionine--8-amino-7-oxononanoate transaminase [Microbulbifer thermotolerans]MCX2805235.1 adenosylmethionine--8-amino-7-oxononanoate transaminase [Microbulbifer thermotolerans]MCX2830901.1 adenosylmethionine--8-amino-7-oxononanoate transaminase [Microbulbifer thermotolerans]WKT59517.1 ad